MEKGNKGYMNEVSQFKQLINSIKNAPAIKGITKILRVKELAHEIRNNGLEIDKNSKFKFNHRKECGGKEILPVNYTNEHYQAAQIVIVSTVSKFIPKKFHRFVQFGYMPPSEENGGYLGWLYKPQQ